MISNEIKKFLEENSCKEILEIKKKLKIFKKRKWKNRKYNTENERKIAQKKYFKKWRQKNKKNVC